MTKIKGTSFTEDRGGTRQPSKLEQTSLRRRLIVGGFTLGAVTLLLLVGATWLGAKASAINSELTAVTKLIPSLKEQITTENAEGAEATVDQLRIHTATAKQAADDPIFMLASSLPGLGPNFSAIAEVTRSADDVARLGLAPLVKVYSSLDWESLLPSASGSDLEPLIEASPKVSAAARAVRLSADRLEQIDATTLVSQVSGPLTSAREQLRNLTGTLDAAANTSSIAPEMLGTDHPRNYLLMIQNNAETRASGGIPGALAVLTLDKGRLTLGSQSSASEVGMMTPALPVDPQQQQIYSSRLSKYMQDVNLTPDFPTAASTAQGMWQKKTGQLIDGVISIDPVVLSYILQSTGPVSLNGPELAAVKAAGLPTELSGSNVVPSLLSDVYAKIHQPKLQDAYFAGVAKEVFAALSSGRGEAKGILTGITRGTEEGRVLLWSAHSSEQAVISKYALSGSISGPSIAPAQFGVYFNDGTGAKMDYYVRRSVRLIRECPAGGYEQTTVRVTSTNTAPVDAATSLSTYVTGGGAFGVPPGTVQTNIVAYGPTQANIESASIDGQKAPFAPYLHSNRPVGVVAQQLAPGESKTVEFTFGKIVQHTEPNLVVTPTVQAVKDVIQTTENTPCGPGQ